MASPYWLSLLALILLRVSSSSCAEQPFTSFTLKNELAERWSAARNNQPELQIQNVLHTILKILKSSSFPTAVGNISNQQCIDDSLLYVHSLYSLATNGTWARQMHESSGGLPIGFFGSGNFHADGLFDECLAIRGPKESGFKGKYCTIFFSTTTVDPSEVLPISPIDGKANLVTIFELINQILGGMVLQSGRVEPKTSKAGFSSYLFPSISFCLPSSCSADDLGQSVAQLVGTFLISEDPFTSILTTADDGYCFTDDPVGPSFDGPEIAVLITFGLLALLVVLATVHESWLMYRGVPFKLQGVSKALHCFSAFNNGRKILSMKTNPSSDNLGCLHGIRVFSTLWVVMGHAWSTMYYYILNPTAELEDAKAWWFQGLGNGTVSVDTFLLMSGLLVSFLLLKELDKTKGRFNLGLFYVHRYLRLTPVYAVILGFIATYLVYIGSGPNWYSVEILRASCRTAWWKHLLYIGNLYNGANTDLCMAQTWYLNVDMQYYLLSPLFVYVLWRWAIPGNLLVITATMASLGACFAVYAIYDLPATIMFTRTRDMALNLPPYFDYYYDLPWTRASPYLVGILLGWFLHVTKQSNRKTPKVVVVLGWILSVAIGLAIIYGLIPYLDEEKVPEIDSAIKITYGSLHRLAWALVVGWVVWACVRGYGGFVNRFLSWRGFLPLSRLTYCVYLIHYNYLTVFYAMNRKQLYYTFISELTTYFGILLTVFGLSFVIAVTVEASFVNLEKLLFTFGKKNPEKKEEPVKLDFNKKESSNGVESHENGSKSIF